MTHRGVSRSARPEHGTGWLRRSSSPRARVPYYRDLFHSIGFDPASLHRSADYLADIPVLTKDIIREQGERLLRDDHASYRAHASKTGGSTGPSAVIMYDQDAADWTSGVIRYARERIGAGATRSEVHFSSRFDGKNSAPRQAARTVQVHCQQPLQHHVRVVRAR